MTTTAFGASVGRGPVNCVLVELDDGVMVGQQSRTIEPGPYRLGRSGEVLASGYDLLAANANPPVSALGVAVRYRRELLAARLGVRQELRSAAVVRDVDAIARVLDDNGAIARYQSALVADLGEAGLRVHTITGGVVTATRSKVNLAVTAGRPLGDTPKRMAEFVSRGIESASRRPEALVLIGSGVQYEGVREALTDAAHAAKLDTVAIDEPEALLATGAALVAADRAAGVATGSARLGGGVGSIGGHSVRLTAAVLPVLVLAALSLAVLLATYATGIIGPAGDVTDPSPEPPITPASDVFAIDSGSPRPASTTPSQPAPRPTDLPRPTSVPIDPGAAGTDVHPTPVMTTFAPGPIPAQPVPTTTATPPAAPPTSPGPDPDPSTQMPTELLPGLPSEEPDESNPATETVTDTSQPEPESTDTPRPDATPNATPATPGPEVAVRGVDRPAADAPEQSDSSVNSIRPSLPVVTAPVR